MSDKGLGAGNNEYKTKKKEKKNNKYSNKRNELLKK